MVVVVRWSLTSSGYSSEPMMGKRMYGSRLISSSLKKAGWDGTSKQEFLSPPLLNYYTYSKEIEKNRKLT